MKKILIVNNNLDMGGIQKSLVNLLKEVHSSYDITLMLFSKSGSLLNDIPEDVKVITPNRYYRILGLTKNELKSYPVLFVLKALMMKYTSVFSRRSAMKLLGLFRRKIKGYDVVISYSHLFHNKYFANGCGDFVLDKTICTKKICMIHCDYLNSGCMTAQNSSEYSEFDRIACCSDSVRERFIQGTKMPKDKVNTLRNFYDFDMVELANDEPYVYDDNCINLLSVARLSSEKGIDRAIEALHAAGRADINYYIAGDGPQKDILREKIKEYGMEKRIILLGEQQNPYRYMINADYLLVPSLHEAAPMVFDEAKILGLKIISTDTTSAREMIGDAYGVVCDNSTAGITKILVGLRKPGLSGNNAESNGLQQRQFRVLVE